MKEIQSFTQAVREEDYESATEALESIREAYDSADGTRIRNRATAASESAAVSSENAVTLKEFSGCHTRTEITRSTFLMNAAVFLSNPADRDSEQVLDLAAQLVDQEQRLTDRRTEADAALSSVVIPASIAVTDVSFPQRELIVDTPFDVTVAFENVGGEPATGVSMTVVTSEGASATPISIDVGTIESTTRLTETVTVHGSAPKEHTLRIELDADNANSEVSQRTFDVVKPTKLVSVALNALATLADLITESTALPRDAKRPLLVSVEETAERALAGGEAIQAGDQTTAIERLEAATTALESLSDEFVAMIEGPDPVCDPDAYEFKQSVNRHIETVSDRLGEATDEVSA